MRSVSLTVAPTPFPGLLPNPAQPPTEAGAALGTPRVQAYAAAIDRITRASQALRQVAPLLNGRPLDLANPEPSFEDASAGPNTPASTPAPRLGDLSMVYETGRRPGEESRAAATVSRGVGDKGGVSYGAYQLASSKVAGRQVQTFLDAEGAPWADRFAGQDAEKAGGDFGATWKSVAAEDPAGFFDAQHAFIARTHYAPVVDETFRKTGLDIGARSNAVQNVVWSMAVQHHRAAHLVTEAIDNLDGEIDPADPGYDRALINELFDVRESYVTRHNRHSKVARRYLSERNDALDMLETR